MSSIKRSLLPDSGDAIAYPNQIVLERPLSAPTRPNVWLVLALLILCLIPRAIMAWKLDVVCTDGVLYIHAAEALGRGDFASAFGMIHLNVFPVVLMLLHGLGLGWEVAGKLWGVALSTAVVLPLFGLARRQFDQRVAVAACFLYAVSPKMIEWSPELVRGPTFWFAFALSLYLIWRAVTEVRLWLFAAAGISVTLAALTRFEGVFLFIPMMLWCFWRLLALRVEQSRFVYGVVLMLAIGPLMLLAINAFVLRGHGSWESIHWQPIVRVQSWINSGLHQVVAAPADGQSVASETSGAQPPAVRAESPMISLGMIWTYLDTMQRGIGPIFGLLMFGSMWVWRGVWARRDHQAIFWAGMAVGAGTWIHLWYAGEISSRYALSVVILGAPFAGLGLVSFLRFTAAAAERVLPSWNSRIAVSTCVIAIITALGCSDALTSHYDTRRARALAGVSIHQRFGSSSVIAGPAVDSGIIGYYAKARYVSFPRASDAGEVLAVIEREQPDAIVLPVVHPHITSLRASLERPGRFTVHRIDRQDFGRAKKRLIVLVRSDAKTSVADASNETKSKVTTHR